MLRAVFDRIVTLVRPDRARLRPRVDFDPETGVLSIRLEAICRNATISLDPRILDSLTGRCGDRRFTISAKEASKFKEFLPRLGDDNSGGLSCTGPAIPDVLEDLRAALAIEETSRAMAIRHETARTAVSVAIHSASALHIAAEGNTSSGQVFPLTISEAARGKVHRIGSTFYRLPADSVDVLAGIDDSGIIEHGGDISKVKEFAVRMDRLKLSDCGVNVAPEAELLISSAKQPVSTELVPWVDFVEADRTLRVALRECTSSEAPVPISADSVSRPHLRDGRFVELDPPSRNMAEHLAKFSSTANGAALRFDGGAGPETIEIVRAFPNTQQSAAAAAMRIHQQPLESRTYLELAEPETLIVRETLATEDQRLITPPELGDRDWPKWIKVGAEYFRGPFTKRHHCRRGQKTADGRIRMEGDEVAAFIADDLPEMRKSSRVFAEDKVAALKIVTAAPQVNTSIDLDQTRSQVIVRPRYRSGPIDIDHQKLRQWDRKRSYYRDGASFHRIDWNEVKRVENALMEADLAEQPDGSYTSPALDLEEIINIFSRLGILSQTEILQKFRERLLGFTKIDSMPLPTSLHGNLIPRDYQQAGYDWLAFLKEHGLPGVLADEMGLGKTLQTLLAVAHFKERFGRCPSLVVCPAALVRKWVDEAVKFFDKLRAVTYGGPRRLDELRENIGTADLVVTSYETLLRDADQLARWKWRFLIADEAQRIKNPSAQRSRAIRKIPAEARIAITGTPVENRLLDLWSIFDFLAPGYLGSSPDFQRRYEQPIMRHGDQASAEELNRRTRHFVMRRLKQHMAKELPDKIPKPLRCDLSQLQRRLYQAVLDHDLDAALKATEGKRLALGNPHIFALLTKLKQICCHPGLVTGDFQPYKSGISRKFDVFREMLDDIAENGDLRRPNKVVGFSQYKMMAGYLRDYTRSRNKKAPL